MRRWAKYLPITSDTPMVSLGEGDTPLVRSRHIVQRVGCEELYFKLEGCNPTGSFKDRGMVVAVAKAVESGAKALICASTGNTSASAAAYGAHLGLLTTVMVPAGNVARGKLAQAVMYGARVVAVEGGFDVCLHLARTVADNHPVRLVNSTNPHRLEGQKTAAFEIIQEVGGAPDGVFIPVGNAGNITAYWKGFVEAHAAGMSGRRPRMFGFQAEGAAPLVLGQPVAEPKTVATAIRIGNPASWKGAVAARDESGGTIEAVSDQEILDAYRLLARGEGVFCEPASAACVAGLLKMAGRGVRFDRQRLVCIITGSGLKDPDLASAGDTKARPVPAELDAVERAMGLV